MSKFSFIKTISFLVVFAFVFDACKKEELYVPVDSGVQQIDNSVIDLIWYPSDIETREDFETGLKWGLSFLGAELPNGCWNNAVEWKSETKFSIDFSKLGFSTNALSAISKINSWFKASSEYQLKGGIDAGRWVVNTFNNSNHYYEIVGMPRTLNGFKSNYIFFEKKAAIVESAVAFGGRIIRMPKGRNWNEQGYLAEEIKDIKSQEKLTQEFEVMDIMSNGQLRFGVYSVMGELINGADPTFSNGGKPAKCLWCHELNVQRAFAAETSIKGYFSHFEFDSLVTVSYNQIKVYRTQLVSEINFSNIEEHAELEKLYIRYMEPSTKRLALEWEKSENEVQRILENENSHNHDEFLDMKSLYHRNEIKNYAPFPIINLTESLRETDYSEKSILN